MTSIISLPVGDEVKVTQKGDDGHSSAIINSALYSADPLNMDIREVQTNITASKSGFETSQFLQRVQPLRSHVWG